MSWEEMQPCLRTSALFLADAAGQGVGRLRQPGAVLLIACYELGHQPLGIASPLGFLEQAGYAPAALDIAVERLNAEKVARARFIGIAVPMHTALRLGVRLVERIRALNPTCHICCYGLYASLNAEYLLAHGVDSVIGGESEAPLSALIESLDSGLDGAVNGVSQRGRHRRHRSSSGLIFACPAAALCPLWSNMPSWSVTASAALWAMSRPAVAASTLPALPHSTGLWWPVFRRAAGGRSGGYSASGAVGCPAHHLR